ncbi:unnamed protein product, partial [Scytosiphon promiscuus]
QTACSYDGTLREAEEMFLNVGTPAPTPSPTVLSTPAPMIPATPAPEVDTETPLTPGPEFVIGITDDSSISFTPAPTASRGMDDANTPGPTAGFTEAIPSLDDATVAPSVAGGDTNIS